MNSQILHCAAAACLFLCCGSAFSGEAPKVVVVTGGHGYEEAPFKEMFDSLKGPEFTFVDLKDDSEIFEDISNWPYDAIVLYNMSQAISEKRRQNFITLLERGVGLVSLHHAIAAFSEWPEYRKIIGTKYWLEEKVEAGVTHPKSLWEEGVEMKLHVEDPVHPVTKGVADFVIHDETYKGYDLEAGNHLLLSCDAPGSQREVAWAREYRNAKVCFVQPGHGADAYANENFRRLLLQAIQWVGTRDSRVP